MKLKEVKSDFNKQLEQYKQQLARTQYIQL